MNRIFFEKQEGQLCAQHALNALLQGHYFTAPDLAEIARRLDSQEHGVFSEGRSGVDSAEYLAQFQFDSQNMDDSGYFSIQVISEAIKIWNLDLVPYKSSSQIALQARENPTGQTAYICNFREHWFTIRRFRNQWINLNSVRNSPEFVSDTYLSLFLTQLQNDGYSIFIVKGDLPPCPADELTDDELTLLATVATNTPSSKTPISANEEWASARSGGGLDPTEEAERAQLDEAIRISLQSSQFTTSPKSNVGTANDPLVTLGNEDVDDEEARMQEVLQRSREELDDDDPSLRQVLAQSLVDYDDEDLKLALQMSLDDNKHDAPSTSSTSLPSSQEVNLEELRQKRLEYLSQKDKNQDSGDKK